MNVIKVQRAGGVLQVTWCAVSDLCVPMKFNSSSFGVLVTLIIVLLEFGDFTEKKFIIQPCTTEK